VSSVDLGGDAQQIAEDVFPQLMGRAVIINLPSFFSTLFVIFKSLLPKRMQVRRALTLCAPRERLNGLCEHFLSDGTDRTWPRMSNTPN